MDWWDVFPRVAVCTNSISPLIVINADVGKFRQLPIDYRAGGEASRETVLACVL